MEQGASKVKRVKKQKDPNYVNPKEFYNEMIKSKNDDELTAKAVDMIIKIANKAVNRLSYKYDEDRQDSIATAIYKCYLYWRSFDPVESNNPFAYFTMICINGYNESYNTMLPVKGVKYSDMVSLDNTQSILF